MSVETPKTTETKRNQFRARNVCYTGWVLPNMGGKNQTYNMYGVETCPTTGKLHYQGYVEFDKIMCMKGVKDSLGDKTLVLDVDLELKLKQLHTAKKNGEVVEWGYRKEQGYRNDLHDIAKEILDGKTTVVDIYKKKPTFYHQYGRTLEKGEEIRLLETNRDWKTKGTWIYGPPELVRAIMRIHKILEKIPILGKMTKAGKTDIAVNLL